VRGRIEQAQGEMNLLTHQVGFSLIKVSLVANAAPVRVLGIDWQPAASAKAAAHSLLSGLGDWANTFVGLFIQLPLYLVWIVSVCALLWAGAISLLWLWRLCNRALPASLRRKPA
jgi:hypothetical protein